MKTGTMTLEQRLGELTDALGDMFSEERHKLRVDFRELAVANREAIADMKAERDKMVAEIVEAVLARIDTATKRH